MNTDHTEIQLTPEQQASIAFHAEREGKTCSELIDERFPILPELNDAELEASLAMIDRGMAQIKAGEGMNIDEARRQTHEKLGFRN